MTAPDHNKTIGILFMIFGACNVLLLIFLGVRLLFAFGQFQQTLPVPTGENYNQFESLRVLFVLFLFLGILNLTAAFIQLTAGFAMVKQKSWARAAGALAAILALIVFPIGTALGVYALWFLLGESGKRFYISVNRTAQ